MEPTLPSPENSSVPPANLSEGIGDVNYDKNISSVENTNIEKQAQPSVPGASTDNTAWPSDDVGQATAVNITTSTQATDDSTPAVADDVDVIEKEWVNKARSIVDATKDDPHKQEKAVSKLQADYLLKRYGKQVKISE